MWTKILLVLYWITSFKWPSLCSCACSRFISQCIYVHLKNQVWLVFVLARLISAFFWWGCYWRLQSYKTDNVQKVINRHGASRRRSCKALRFKMIRYHLQKTTRTWKLWISNQRVRVQNETETQITLWEELQEWRENKKSAAFTWSRWVVITELQKESALWCWDEEISRLHTAKTFSYSYLQLI